MRWLKRRQNSGNMSGSSLKDGTSMRSLVSRGGAWCVVAELASMMVRREAGGV